MDLFTPTPEYNYNFMIKDIDFNKFDNPYIQVIWEDYAENFTQEKIKSVKHYFQKKYNSTNINVITKTKSVETTNHSVDVSFNILDKNYQYDDDVHIKKKNKVIVENRVVYKDRIKQVEKIIDAECKVAPEAIDIHNAAAKNVKLEPLK